MCRSYSPSRIRRLSVRVPCSCLSSWGGGVKKGKKGKRPLLEAHCCSVKIVRHQSAVAPEKRKRGRKKHWDVLESTYIPCLLWPCVSLSSLPPLFPPLLFPLFFLTHSMYLSLSFTLFHGLLALILLHTQIETDTQGGMIKMFREKYGWRRGERLKPGRQPSGEHMTLSFA